MRTYQKGKPSAASALRPLAAAELQKRVREAREEGEYHYGDAAWAYVKRRTGVDLLGILRDLAAERTAQHGK